MNYLKHFELKKEPFSNAPVRDFYFNSKNHSDAMLRLKYVVEERKGLGVVMGKVGTGKTTLARRLFYSLDDSEYVSGMIVMVHSGITSTWLLGRIAQQLGVINPSKNKLERLKQLYRRLVQIDRQGKKAVILIDEAQMLATKDIWEELRGVLNMEITNKKLITFLLFGLEELNENIQLDEPFSQRVALKYQLKPLSLNFVNEYIKFRLISAGAKKMCFSRESVVMIYKFSTGIPRLINTICDNAMFESYVQKKTVITKELIVEVATSLGLENK